MLDDFRSISSTADDLSSFDILGIDKNSADELLDSAIVAIIKK